MVLDLDRLKPVVDTYGHLVGSYTIATVGRLIAEALRPGDVAARFGGDEFVVLLPHTDTREAREIAERIRAAVEACAFHGGVEAARVKANVRSSRPCRMNTRSSQPGVR
jgi:diguanylate cyclase (GGDEF)-like protein